MANSTETPRKKKKAGELVLWGVMAMLVVGLGGFGLENFGGGASTLASVGDRKITASDYGRQLQQQINSLSQQMGQPLNMEQARSFGVDRQVIAGLIDLAAQDAESERLGLSVGDAVVASQLTRISAFQGPTGSFDRDTYAFTLKRNNLTETRFEQSLRDDISRAMLLGAVRGGFQAPATLTDTLYGWMGERRAISALPLTGADLATPVAATPDEAALQAWYQANLSQFTRPEAKKIGLALLEPADLEKTLPASESEARALYDQRSARYDIPEKRLVERLVFPDEATAAAARARFDAGTGFEDLVKERGLALSDIDMGDVTRAGLGPAGDAVFALTGPGVAGPVNSSLGPALFRVNAILAAQKTPFEEVRTDLETEVRATAARREIEGRVAPIDDALAGGATLADLAREQGMRVSSFDYVPGADDNDPIAASAAFRKAADAAQEGDFPEAVLLEDGGIAVIEVQATVPPAPLPFEAVRSRVEAAVKADELDKALAARAAEIKQAVEGGARLETFGIVDVTPQLAREGTLPDAPDGTMAAVFEMQPGEIRILSGAGKALILRVDQVIPAARDTAGADALRQAIRAQIDQSMSDDALRLWTDALTAEAGISIDQRALDAVNAQFN